MITYLKGDATEPCKTPAVIVHVCNDLGKWGAGFVLALSKKWRGPELAYRTKKNYELGQVNAVYVDSDIMVANMIAQSGTRSKDNPVPLRKKALAECLLAVDKLASANNMSVHMPRIGCGLAGGKWEEVEQIINLILDDAEVFVYDLA